MRWQPEETKLVADGRCVTPSVDASVATPTLDRPDKLDGLIRAMHHALVAVLDAIEADAGVRTVELAASGRGFCAAQDLSDRSFGPAAPTDLGELIERNFSPLARRLQALPIPIVARVQGIAAVKRSIHASQSSTLDAQVDLERGLQAELGRSDDYKERVNAFLEKRAPRFTGR